MAINKAIREEIARAYESVKKEISCHDGSFYARGLAGEGWAGGYAAAMQDMLLAIRGVKPNTRSYWDGWSYRDPKDAR
jgi:hypothetical protein